MSEKRELFTRCGGWRIKGVTESGEEYAKVVDCGRECCPVCGERAKMRRFSRCVENAQRIKSMAYLNVTYPPDAQPRTQERMNADRKALFNALEMWGVKEFFGRTHFFGDPPPDGSSPRQHSHHGVLFEGGWLKPREMESFLNTIRWMMRLPDNANIYYQYSEKVGWMIHKLKYINRNTFLDFSWDYELAYEFFGRHKNVYNRKTREWDSKRVVFKNSFSRGNVRCYTGEVGVDKNGKTCRKYEMRWASEKAWEFDEDHRIYGYVAKIQMGISPLSGEKIHWQRICKDEDLPDDYMEIWDGVYQRNPPSEIVLRYKALKAFAVAQRSPPVEVGL